MRLSVGTLQQVVNRDLPIEFAPQRLTSYGGLELLQLLQRYCGSSNCRVGCARRERRSAVTTVAVRRVARLVTFATKRLAHDLRAAVPSYRGVAAANEKQDRLRLGVDREILEQRSHRRGGCV